MASNRNKQAGSKFELEIVHVLEEMGYEAVTSRHESRRADAAGIDLVSDFPLKIQAKCMVNTPAIHTLLTETEAEVIFWKKTKKKGTRFYEEARYAMLPLDTFLNLFIKNK